MTLKIAKINSVLSKHVNLITYNSNKALENHIKFGYKDKDSIVIPNGFELDRFRFSLADRLKVRKELGLIEEDRVIITIGRWDIQKDYYTLLKALNELKGHNLKFKMIMVGTHLDYLNDELVNLVKKYSLSNDIILLGRRDDIPELLSAADIYVSSSLGESFSNAIGEAMACELLCVVTDVGDSKLMVGDTGQVVQAGNYVDMGKALRSYLERDNIDRNIETRNRVIDNYEIKKITKMFEENYQRVN